MKIFEFRDGDSVSLPDNSKIFYVEHIPDGDYIEVWAAVPEDSVVSSTDVEIDEYGAKRYNGPTILHGQADVTGLPKPDTVKFSELHSEKLEDGSRVMFLGDDDE